MLPNRATHHCIVPGMIFPEHTKLVVYTEPKSNWNRVIENIIIDTVRIP